MEYALPIVCLGIVGCASGHHRPFLEENPTVRQLEAITARLHNAVERSSALTMKIIGQVRYDRFEAPVALIRFVNSLAEEPRILLAGGVHGNEPVGVESAVSVVERLADHPDLLPACRLAIIPLAMLGAALPTTGGNYRLKPAFGRRSFGSDGTAIVDPRYCRQRGTEAMMSRVFSMRSPMLSVS